MSSASLTASLPAVSKGWRARGHVVGWPALGALLLAVLVLIALLGPFAGLPDPGRQALGDRLAPPLTTSADGTLHLLGTDQLGRDMLGQVVHGARVSMLVAASTVGIAGVVGTALGLVAGYTGGATDTVLMALVDVQLAIPPLLLAILIAAMLGPSVPNVILTLSVIRWAVFARLARGSTLALREKEFVEAARALGASHARIMGRHVLINILTPLVILATLQIALQMLAEAALSFLGLGIPHPLPSWGVTISQGRDYLQNAWWIATLPGGVMTLAVLAAGAFGDALRDYLDPRFGY
ncbi:MAG: ABC transporter permease [Firmicutes bacterium]|nr:ABC transporter permease [Bacillota bacterium]